MAKDLHAAVLALQSEIGTLQKNALNPHFKSRYLSLDALVEHVQPLLTKHGLIWSCEPHADIDGRPMLLYRLLHAESGEFIGNAMPLLLEKNNAQGLGSAITYARRYALCAVLNIVADVDDDGEKAAKQKPATKERAAVTLADQLRGVKTGAEIKKFVAEEFGATLDDVGTSKESLIHYLNGLDALKRASVLAWSKVNE